MLGGEASEAADIVASTMHVENAKPHSPMKVMETTGVAMAETKYLRRHSVEVQTKPKSFSCCVIA